MLAPWKKSYDQPRHQIKKQKHYFTSKGTSSQSYGFFPVVMYGCESCTIKKAEHRRIDAFKLWWWRRLLRVPWIARRSNQSILKEISPGHTLVELMLKLKLQYLATWCEELTHWKDPDARTDWRQAEKGATEDEMVGWHHQLNGYEFDQAPGVGGGQGSLACCSPWGCRVGHDWVTILNWRVWGQGNFGEHQLG